MDCNPWGSSVHGILQARILEWVAISFSRASARPRDWTNPHLLYWQEDSLPTEPPQKSWLHLSLNSLLEEKAMTTHSSTLAWKIPWAEEPGRLRSMGSRRVGHDWATSLFTFMHWRRKWQPTPVFLPGESQGRGSLVGCQTSMGSHRVGHDWRDLAAAAAAVVIVARSCE